MRSAPTTQVLDQSRLTNSGIRAVPVPQPVTNNIEDGDSCVVPDRFVENLSKAATLDRAQLRRLVDYATPSRRSRQRRPRRVQCPRSSRRTQQRDRSRSWCCRWSAFLACSARRGSGSQPGSGMPEVSNGSRDQIRRLASTGMTARVCSTRSRSRSTINSPGSAPNDCSTSPRGEITAL
jgi:hypothetical protein